MKRYDIDIEGGDWMNAASLDITEQDDGEWVKWEDHAEKVARLERINKRLVAQVDRLAGALNDAEQ